MPVEMKSVAGDFKKNRKRTWHVPSVRLKNVDRALDDYLKAPSPGNLKLLSVMVEAWLKTDPKEYENCKGSVLHDAIYELAGEPDTKRPEQLKDGDILFRFVPHNIGQRGGVQWLITMGQGVAALTQGTGTGWNWDMIQHVGIYVENGLFTGVREIAGSGLAKYKVGARDHVIDLVVRCDDEIDGHDIGRVAACAKALKTRKWGTLNLGRKQKTIPLGPGQDAKALSAYPVQDLFWLTVRGRRPEIFNEKTLLELKELNDQYIGNHEDRNELSQSVVCSHFVHAVMYAAARPDVVTLRSATSHKLERVFKISPSHLWQAFHYRAGIFDILPAHFAGVEQDGFLYPMEEKDLGSQTIGLAA